MSEINIDDLQREISAAETYLLQRPPASSTRSSVAFSSERGSTNSLDKAEKSIEQQQIEAAAPVPEGSPVLGSDIMQLNRILLRSQREEIETDREAFVDYMHPSALSSSSGSHHSQHQSPSRSTGSVSSARSPYNKYDDPVERDKLIAKLLEEHGRSNDKSKQQHYEGSSSPTRLSGAATLINNASPNRASGAPPGRYQAYQESRLERKGSMDSSDGASGIGSYSAAFESRAGGGSPGADEGASIGFRGHKKEQEQELADETLFFASDLNASMDSAGSRDRLPSAEKIMRAELRTARGHSESIGSHSSDGAASWRASQEGKLSDAALIYGSYEGDEDSAMYVPESDGRSELREVSDDMMATVKAVHSSVPGDPASVLGHHGEHHAGPHVAWADEQQAAVSSSIPALQRTDQQQQQQRKDKKEHGKSRPSSAPIPSSTSAPVLKKATKGPPSRLMEPRKKEWKYVKSKEQCEEEGMMEGRRGGHGTYSFKPRLSAYVRKQKKSGEGELREDRRQSIVSALFNNRPLPQDKKDEEEEEEETSKGHSKFDVRKVSKSIRQHHEKVEARERLKQHVENMEVQACTFKPAISKKAQELASNARVQQMQILQEEQIASRYFSRDALPQRIDPTLIDDSLTIGQEGYTQEPVAYQQREGPNNPFNHLTEDSEGNLVYEDALPDDPYAHHLGEQVSERLHREAHTRAEQQRWLEVKVREARAAEHSFQPAITSQASKHYEMLKKEYGVDHVPIYERVGELQKVKQKRMQDLREALEEEEGRSNTFNPSIDKKSREIAERKKRENENARAMALHQAAMVEQKKEEQDLLGESEDKPAHRAHRMSPFTSAIHAAMVDSNNDNKGPSNGGLGNATQAALERFFGEEDDSTMEQKEKDLQAAVTEDAPSRLLKEGRATEMKMMYLQVMREREIAEQCKPAAVSKGSTAIAEESAFVGATFAERQKMYQEKVKQRQLHRQARTEATAANFFHPNTRRATRIVAASKPRMLVETKEERSTRLSRHDVEAKNRSVQAMDKELYKDVTFKPNLTKKSRQLAAKRHSNLEDLVENPKGKAVREELRRRVQEEERRTLTFHPNVPEYRPEHGHYDEAEVSVLSSAANARVSKENKVNLDPYAELYGDDLPGGRSTENLNDAEAPSVQNQSGVAAGQEESFAAKSKTTSASVQLRQSINMKEPEKMSRSIRQDLQKKEEQRRMAVVKGELRDLEQCTFKPSVVPYDSRKADRGPVVIPGLERHLELKNMVQKKKEDKIMREQEVFSVRNAEDMRKPEDGTTIQQPFHLSESDKRPSRAVLELQEQEERDLTFTPHTENVSRRNEGRRAARAHTALRKNATKAVNIYK